MSRTRIAALAVVAVPAVILAVVVPFLPRYGATQPWPLWAGAGLAVGAGLGVLSLAYFKLRTRLGTFTALAAIALIGSVVTLGLAMLPSHCPQTELTTRCDTAAAGVWLMTGALTPLLFVLLISPLVLLALTGRWGWKHRSHIRTVTSLVLIGPKKKPQAPAGPTVKGQTSPKGRPTPKRARRTPGRP